MKLEKIRPNPSLLMAFVTEGFGSLGALCEKTWHDRLEIVADGPAAGVLGTPGSLAATELTFPDDEADAPRDPARAVFPGCPITFRLVEALWQTMPRTLRAAIPAVEKKPPTEETLQRAWERHHPGAPRVLLSLPVRPAWHFSLVALMRCEIQAIDQHWSLHRLALSWPDGEPDDNLQHELRFLDGDSASPDAWPEPGWEQLAALILGGLRPDIEADIAAIRKRQEHYLRRELDRIDCYFANYRKELEGRGRRASTADEASGQRFAERLAAAGQEHLRRRNDQVSRHEISVSPYLDALLWIAEPAWKTEVRRVERTEPWLYLPRVRRWVRPAE